MIRVDAVGMLVQQPAVDVPALNPAAHGRLGYKNPEILLGSEEIDCPDGVPGGDDHLGEDLRNLSRHVHSDRPIGSDHTSVCRDWIARVGLSMCLGYV